MRGIIISSFYFDGRALSIRGGVDDLALRQYVLYWDRIDYPNNNLLRTEMSPDMQYLANEGILERTKITFSGFRGNPGYLMLIMQTKAFQIRNGTEPGIWSLGQELPKLLVPNEVQAETKTIEVELYNALPVPSSTVAIHDILDFKEKRKDELLAFRSAMDELYLSVLSSNDIPRSKIKAIGDIERAIENINRVANESWVRKLVSSLKVEINVPNLVTNAAIGAGMGTVFGFSPAVGAAIGAAAATIKFDLGLSFGLSNLPSEVKDYAYLYRIKDELK